jgi:DNA topoisomerase IB
MPRNPFGCGKQRAATGLSHPPRAARATAGQASRRASGGQQQHVAINGLAHARLPGLPRENVMACILRILSTCFMRLGSEVYAKANGSFGIATLQNRHASVEGDTVRFRYRGKAGKEQVNELRDRRVARILRELKKVPGRDLFQYVVARC